MPDSNPFLVFTSELNRLHIPYMITGSVAATLYGEPRFTLDVDLVMELTDTDVQTFEEAFPLERFYCPPGEVLRSEIRRSLRGHFNLIHHETGLKADIYLKGRDPLHAWAMEHRRSILVDSEAVYVAPPEYVILRKLEYFREGGSEKHIVDSQAIAALTRPLDTEWLKAAAHARGLTDLLGRVLQD